MPVFSGKENKKLTKERIEQEKTQEDPKVITSR